MHAINTDSKPSPVDIEQERLDLQRAAQVAERLADGLLMKPDEADEALYAAIAFSCREVMRRTLELNELFDMAAPAPLAGDRIDPLAIAGREAIGLEQHADDMDAKVAKSHGKDTDASRELDKASGRLSALREFASMRAPASPDGAVFALTGLRDALDGLAVNAGEDGSQDAAAAYRIVDGLIRYILRSCTIDWPDSFLGIDTTREAA